MKYKISDIAKVVNGSTPSTSDASNYDGDIVWITPKDLSEQKSKYIERGSRNITSDGYASCSTQMIPAYNLLMSSRAPIGLFAINTVDCCTNQGFKNVILNKEKVDVDFIYYFLKFHICEIEALGSGTTFKEVSKSALEKYEIDIPSLDEQRKIAKVLSNLDEKIALNRAMNEELEAMARQLYDYWFLQFDFPDANGKPYRSSGGKMVYNDILKREIPEGWEVGKVGDYIYPFERGISYKSSELIDPNGIPMLNLAVFDKKGEYRTGELKYFSGSYTETDKVCEGDMLIACTDLTRNADIIGTPILVDKESDFFVYTMDLAKLTPKNVSKYYLYSSLKETSYRNYIKPFASGTNVLHLNLFGVEEYPLVQPLQSVQEAFDKIIGPIKKHQSEHINESIRLTSLRDELLPLLMNGQVEVKNRKK